MNDDLLKDFLLEAFPNPGRKGCPDEITLKALAQDRLPANHAARLHVGSCSECYAEYRHYRLDWADLGGSASPTQPLHSTSIVSSSAALHRLRVLLAVAASLILFCGAGYLVYWHNHSETPPNSLSALSQPVPATVDLFNSGTIRGVDNNATPLHEVSLPAAIVHLSVILPRFSDPGRYDVMVSKSQDGTGVVAMDAGQTISRGNRVTVAVTLDLRAAIIGSYFLATVRSSDDGTYYYPLKIKGR